MFSKLILLFGAINVFVLTTSNGQSICPVGTQRIPGSKRTTVQMGCCAGYNRDPSSVILKCDPVCSPPCGINATCSAPNNCTCNRGYEMIGSTCSPHCSAPCVHGQCVAPNVCGCLTGYHKISENTCAPTCSSGCKHGVCVARDMCLCDEGYTNARDGSCVRHDDMTTRKTTQVTSTVASNDSQGHGFKSKYVWIPLLVIALVILLTVGLIYTRQYLKGYHRLFIIKDNSGTNSTSGVIPNEANTPRMDFDNITFSSISG